MNTASKLYSRLAPFHMWCRLSSSGLSSTAFWPLAASKGSIGRMRAYTRILPCREGTGVTSQDGTWQDLQCRVLWPTTGVTIQLRFTARQRIVRTGLTGAETQGEASHDQLRTHFEVLHGVEDLLSVQRLFPVQRLHLQTHAGPGCEVRLQKSPDRWSKRSANAGAHTVFAAVWQRSTILTCW